MRFNNLCFLVLSLCALMALSSSRAAAQQLRLNGGNQTMTISTGVAGGQLTDAVNTSCTLRYRRQSTIAKITVATSCPGQNFTLRVLALSVTRGVAAPEVTLQDGAPAMDLITGIPSSGFTNATCTLRYTAAATFAQGNSTEVGNDVHAITYTLQAQ